jgi:hypothetical protein
MGDRVDLAQQAPDPSARGLTRHRQCVGEQSILAEIL